MANSGAFEEEWSYLIFSPEKEQVSEERVQERGVCVWGEDKGEGGRELDQAMNGAAEGHGVYGPAGVEGYRCVCEGRGGWVSRLQYDYISLSAW